MERSKAKQTSKQTSKQRRVEPTYRPLPLNHTLEHFIQLFAVFHPLPAHQRHTHSPQTPAQERHPLQLFLRKPATAPQHASTNRQLLNQVEIRPLDMVADHNSRLSGRERIASNDDVRFIGRSEYALDVLPYRSGDQRGSMVRCGWREEGQW
jgi:hypothetical protein